MNKENDPRYIRCEELLQETLKQMIEQTDFESISITKLCQKAGVNRKTFYLHYKTIDDLLFATLNALNTKVKEKIQYIDINNLNELLFKYIEYIENENIFYEKIISNDTYSYILNRNLKNFFNSIHDLYKPLRNIEKNKQSLIIIFINNTFFGLYKEWVLTGKKISIKVILELMSNLIDNGIKHYQ